MPMLVSVVLANLPAIIEGATSGYASIARIIRALRDNAPSLTPEQLETLTALETRLIARLADVADVPVR